METNEPGNTEKFFTEFGKKFDQFMIELKDASNRMESDLKKRYEELRQAAERISKEARDKQKWKDIEADLKRAGKEMEEALKSAFKKKN
jgi:hypothetical protein